MLYSKSGEFRETLDQTTLSETFILDLELLCKSCHAKEHEVVTNITGRATTIPTGSRDKRLEAPDTLLGDDIV